MTTLCWAYSCQRAYPAHLARCPYCARRRSIELAYDLAGAVLFWAVGLSLFCLY